MADKEKMHPEFSRWYSTVNVDGNQNVRSARWSAVCAIADVADAAIVEGLIRIAFASRQPATNSMVEGLRKHFKEADENFEMTGNDRELQVLASACLAITMEDNEDSGPIAALATTTTSFANSRKPELPMDLGHLGERAMVKWAETNRQRPSLRTSTDVPALRFEKATAKLKEQQDFNGVLATFPLLGADTQAALKQLAVRQAQTIRSVETFLRVQDEELQMLWWLVGQRSTVCDCSFEDVPPNVQPLIFASELGESTECLPGPTSIKALLSRAGLKEERQLTVTEVVNAAKPDWLQTLIGEKEVSPVSTPIHEAIKRLLETGVGPAWIAGWAASVGVAEDCSMPALTLGNLFYRERLLRTFE